MEWIKQMSLRKSMFLIVIVSLASGQLLYNLVMQIIRGWPVACMCTYGSHSITLPAAIFMSIVVATSMPIIAAMVFYRIKLKTPLSQLNMGAKRIKENDLDFSVKYSSKDELGQLCESFEAMRIALLKSNRELWQQMEERKRLNAAFAHDLRNPVTVLKGSAAILQKRLEQGTLTSESATESISLITQYSTRIESYIQAMTSVQKLEELAFTPKMYEWLPLAQELKGSLSILGADTGKEIEFLINGENRQIRVDRYMVYNVAENLASNALRYSKDSVIVEMSCDDEKITVSVSDDGTGFPPAILKKGAVPFLRDDTAEQGQNFGMGLYICHLLCEKHGGGLTLENHPNGAKATGTFYFDQQN